MNLQSSTYLVGGFEEKRLWKRLEFVNWDSEIPNMWKNKIHVPNRQPTCLLSGVCASPNWTSPNKNGDSSSPTHIWRWCPKSPPQKKKTFTGPCVRKLLDRENPDLNKVKWGFDQEVGIEDSFKQQEFRCLCMCLWLSQQELRLNLYSKTVYVYVPKCNDVFSNETRDLTRKNDMKRSQTTPIVESAAPTNIKEAVLIISRWQFHTIIAGLEETEQVCS